MYFILAKVDLTLHVEEVDVAMTSLAAGRGHSTLPSLSGVGTGVVRLPFRNPSEPGARLPSGLVPKSGSQEMGHTRTLE